MFSPAAEEVRAFFRHTLGLPPAELAVHPADEAQQEIYLMCDDLDATVAELERRAWGWPVRSVSRRGVS